jgi:hypothetical protein
MREKSRDFLGFSYDFFLPYESVNPMEFDLVRTLGSPSFEDAEVQPSERANRFVADRVGLDVCAGVVFLLHVYKIPQTPEKARDFFTILQIIFVDTPSPFLKKFEQAF